MQRFQIYMLLLLIQYSLQTAIGQNVKKTGDKYSLYQLEARLMKGDKTALFEIAQYFDSEKEIIEFLGHHRIETNESAIAIRIVRENCLFTDEEFKFLSTTATNQFVSFLNDNNDKIIFSELANAFLITPLEKRKVNFKIRATTEIRKKELKDNVQLLLKPEWIKKNKIDSFIQQKNPMCLLLIASEFFKIRSRFNRHYYKSEEFTNILEYLTSTQIGVENEEMEITWHVEEDYYPQSKLNLLIYFSKFYSDYVWNNEQEIFINPNHEIKPIGKEDMLFQLLLNEDDTIAMNAFIELTTCKVNKVTQLADEYQKISKLYSFYPLPTFPYSFLKQLVIFTHYCKSKDIDFIGTSELQADILLLQKNLTFVERRKLEDKLINSLTLNDINAFEYWSLIYESANYLTFSAERILDIFYSRNWNKLLADKKQLECYLKKSFLFNELGIIGACNNYLEKFTNSSQSTLTLLKNIETNDSVIKEQIEKVVLLNTLPNEEKEPRIYKWPKNDIYNSQSLKKQINKLISHVKDSSKTHDALMLILSQISYKQIPEALEAIENYPFEDIWYKYSFMNRDWGFLIFDNFENKETREKFLKLYAHHSEFELYAYYLDQAEIDYKIHDGKLDYDKIFELIKYNVVVAFAGGGNVTKDNEVYSLVKLLELTFKTTLDFPDKLCQSRGVFGCNSGERAKVWMKYLSENNLLMQKHNDPPSFSHY